MLKHENSSEPGPDGKPLIKDPSDLGSFDSDAKSIRENAAKLFHSKTDEAEFMANYDLDTVVAKNRLQSIYMKQQIQQGQADTMADSDRLGNLYATTGDKQYLDQQEALWKVAVAKNQFDPKDGYEKRTKAADEARFNNFLNDFQKNPTEAAKNVNNYGLSIEQKQKAMNLSTQSNKIVNENRAINYGLASEDALNGLIKYDDVDRLVAMDKENPGSGIREKDAPKLRKAIVSGIYYGIGDLTATNEDAKKFVSSIDSILASKPADKIDAYSKILDIYADGYANQNESKFLNQLVKSETAIARATKKDLSNLFQRMFDKGYDAKQNKVVVEEIHTILKKLQEGKTVPEAVKDMTKEKLVSENPTILSYPKGRIGIDRTTGIKYRYFPDGSKEKVD